MNKASKIEKLLRAGTTVADVVKKLKVSKSYVYLIIHKRMGATTRRKKLLKEMKPLLDAFSEKEMNSRAQDWVKKNKWFGVDEEMTALALAIHQKLVKEGIDPKSAEYYGKIDASLVKLTATQTALANKLGVSKEAYARELVKMSKRVKDIMAVGTEVGGLVLTSPEKGKYWWVRKDLVDTPDTANHPPEVIDFIEAKGLNYHLGQVVRYVSRVGKKGNALEDLRKAQWYLNREIARAEQ